MSQFLRNKKELLKEKCLAYLGGKKCYHCKDSSLPICCYDFHHWKDKDEEISKMITLDESFDKIKKELDKCRVVCANCHRQVTTGIIRLKCSE